MLPCCLKFAPGCSPQPLAALLHPGRWSCLVILAAPGGHVVLQSLFPGEHCQTWWTCALRCLNHGRRGTTQILPTDNDFQIIFPAGFWQDTSLRWRTMPLQPQKKVQKTTGSVGGQAWQYGARFREMLHRAGVQVWQLGDLGRKGELGGGVGRREKATT